MTYDYNCPECGIFTVERSIKDEPLKECPKCGQPIKRIYATTDYIAKCSGFYGKTSK